MADADKVAFFWSLVEVAGADECWPFSRTDKNGYGVIYFDGKVRLAHRISWMLTHGEYPTLFVCHSCDNPPCVNPRHHFIGTQADNMADAVSKARFPRGESARWTKLTESKVIEIRTRFAGGERISDLARAFGISHQCMAKVCYGKSWRHVAAPFAIGGAR